MPLEEEAREGDRSSLEYQLSYFVVAEVRGLQCTIRGGFRNLAG